MSIELAEKLKEKLTDKFVVVDKSIPELRRFANWTGKVKTVNMSCRALVEFDGPVDIGWYDIDPDYLKVVDAPVKKAPAPASQKRHPAESKPAAKPATPQPGKARWTRSVLSKPRKAPVARPRDRPGAKPFATRYDSKAASREGRCDRRPTGSCCCCRHPWLNPNPQSSKPLPLLVAAAPSLLPTTGPGWQATVEARHDSHARREKVVSSFDC